MKAWQVERIGAQPQCGIVADPVPGAGDVLIRIHAAGLNFADLLMIDGRYQDTPALPYIPGMEVAGTVEALGPGVTAPAVGTRVAVFAGQGALAERMVCPAHRCLTLPDAMSFEEAAAFQIAYGTSHLALARRAGLGTGETLLVTGAAGGVGLTAVEIGKRLGARVIAIARGDDKLAVAGRAGADHLIDSESDDILGQLRALGGVDVAYEAVGGALFEAAFRALRPEGRMLTIGFAGGEVPQIKANHLLVKNISVIGLYWGGYLSFRPDVLNDSLRDLLGWYEKGWLRPHVSHVLPFDRLDQALALLKDRKSTGKVVVCCDASP